VLAAESGGVGSDVLGVVQQSHTTTAVSVRGCLHAQKSSSRLLELEDETRMEQVSVEEESDQDRQGHVLLCCLRAGAATRNSPSGDIKHSSMWLTSYRFG
jgi:hypothetical protein